MPALPISFRPSHPPATQAQQPLRRIVLAVHLLLIATAGAALLASPQFAQAQASQARTWNLPAAPLEESLNRFAQQAGINLTANPALTHGRQAPAISGSLTQRQALDQLLAGSGLEGVIVGNAVTVRARPSSSAPGTLPEVVVTASPSEITENTGSYTTGSTSAATGLNLSLRETPQSISVVTRQRMDDGGLDSLGQILEYVPGVSNANSAGTPIGGVNIFSSRGYTITNFQVDGVSAPSQGWSGNTNGTQGLSALDSALYDSVTVVRGATGLLDGAGNPSGSISLTRKRPTDQFQASVAQSLGSWSQRRTVGDVGGPLNAAGTLRGRLVAAYDEGGTQLDRYQGYKSTAYGVLEADLSERTLLSLGLEHGRQTALAGGNYAGFAAFSDGTPSPFTRSDNTFTDWTNYHTRRTTLATRLEHHFNDDWQARLGYSYSQNDADYKFGAISRAIQNPINPSGLIYLTKSESEAKVHALDARLEGKYRLGGQTHDLVAGFNASDVDTKVPFFNSPDRIAGAIGFDEALNWDGSGYPEPDWSTFTNDPWETRTRQSGLYLATRLRATDALSFIAGGRLSSWKTQTRRESAAWALTDDRKESAVFTPYAAVIYDLTSNLSAYASYTEIFNPQNYRDVNNNFLDPETGKNIELGLKGEWFDGRLNTSAAVFQSGKDNLAVIDDDNLTPSGVNAYRAEDDTKARGWELEASGELARGWHVQTGYTRVVLKDSSGARLSTSSQPKHQFKLFTTWTPARLSRLTVGGGVLWQSEIYSTYLPDIYKQKSYAVVNLVGRYAFNDRLSLSVNLNNLFDKVYTVSTIYNEYGPGRNLYATLKYQF